MTDHDCASQQSRRTFMRFALTFFRSAGFLAITAINVLLLSESENRSRYFVSLSRWLCSSNNSQREKR